MNRFNDIIKENQVLEIPYYINNIYDYGTIIKNAFALTGGLLSLDNNVIEEETKHIKIIITSKNIQTRFKLNRLDNNQVDQKNLVRGLNRALTDIFYLGDARFYIINGIVVPFGIGFISSKQKRHLLKYGLIGNDKIMNTVDKVSEKEIHTDIIKDKQQQSEENFPDNLIKAIPQNPNDSFAFTGEFNEIEKQLDNKNSLDLFTIVHYPEEYEKNVVDAAIRMSILKGVPVFNPEKYAEHKKLYSDIIDRIVKLSNKSYDSGQIHKILNKNNLKRSDKFLILAEVQRTINAINPTTDWKLVLKIIIFIVMILIILARL